MSDRSGESMVRLGGGRALGALLTVLLGIPAMSLAPMLAFGGPDEALQRFIEAGGAAALVLLVDFLGLAGAATWAYLSTTRPLPVAVAFACLAAAPMVGAAGFLVSFGQSLRAVEVVAPADQAIILLVACSESLQSALLGLLGGAVGFVCLGAGLLVAGTGRPREGRRNGTIAAAVAAVAFGLTGLAELVRLDALAELLRQLGTVAPADIPDVVSQATVSLGRIALAPFGVGVVGLLAVALASARAEVFHRPGRIAAAALAGLAAVAGPHVALELAVRPLETLTVLDAEAAERLQYHSGIGTHPRRAFGELRPASEPRVGPIELPGRDAVPEHDEVIDFLVSVMDGEAPDVGVGLCGRLVAPPLEARGIPAALSRLVASLDVRVCRDLFIPNDRAPAELTLEVDGAGATLHGAVEATLPGPLPPGAGHAVRVRVVRGSWQQLANALEALQRAGYRTELWLPPPLPRKGEGG